MGGVDGKREKPPSGLAVVGGGSLEEECPERKSWKKPVKVVFGSVSLVDMSGRVVRLISLHTSSMVFLEEEEEEAEMAAIGGGDGSLVEEVVLSLT